MISVFPSILIKLENGPNEFYFLFYQLKWQYNQPGCSIKDKTKKQNWNPELYWHESEGNTKIKLKKISFIYFQISKNWVVRVGKTKNKKTWPKRSLVIQSNKQAQRFKLFASSSN